MYITSSQAPPAQGLSPASLPHPDLLSSFISVTNRHDGPIGTYKKIVSWCFLRHVYAGIPLLKKLLGSLFNNPTLSDIKIRQKHNGEVKEFYAHKAVLCTHSEWFTRALTGQFKVG